MNKIGLIFPGQGSQYIGMTRKIYEGYGVVREVYEEAGDVLGFDLSKLVLEGKMEDLTTSENAQPAVVTASIAYFRLYMQEVGITPHFSAGHSLGEISALIAGGGISFKDGVEFARKRGRYMQQAFLEKKGSMGLAVNLTEEKIESVLSSLPEELLPVQISSYNSPTQFLISGTSEGILEFSRRIKGLKGEFYPFKMIAMKVDAPFHSRLMDFIREGVEKELLCYSYSELKWPVIANVTGLPYKNHRDITQNLSLQLVSPVKWFQGLEYMEKEGVTYAFETGPQQVLKNLVTGSGCNIRVLSMDHEKDFEQIQGLFCSTGKHRLDKLSSFLKLGVSTRNSHLWDDEDYNREVVVPYRELKQLYLDRENSVDKISIEDVENGARLTARIIGAKNPALAKKMELFTKLERLEPVYDRVSVEAGLIGE